MRYILHPVAYTIWLLALGISVALAWQFHGGDNTVALAIALLALGLSAFGVIFARDALQRHDWFAALCGIVLWAAGAVFFTITEIGYWDSSYNRHYTEYQQVKTAKARADGLNDRRWNALTTGDIPATPAQIKAQIAIAQVNERWASTKGCSDVTTVPSREFCAAYFKLQSQLAVAEERVTMEQQFARDIAEKEGHIVQNLLAGAEVLARRLVITERQAADLVIFAAWALLFLARDLGGVVANPLGRRKISGVDVRNNIGQTDGIAAEVSDIDGYTPRPMVGLISQLTPEQQKLLWSYDGPEYLGPADGPGGGGGGTPANLSEIPNSSEVGKGSRPLESHGSSSEPDFETVIETASNVTKLFSDDMPRPMPSEHAFGAEVRIRRSQDDVKTFFRERLGIDQEARAAMLHAIRERKALDGKVAGRLMDSPDVYDLYLSWYGDDEEGAMGPKPFSNKLNDYLGIPPGTRKLKGVKGIRNGKGARFPVYAREIETKKYARA